MNESSGMRAMSTSRPGRASRAGQKQVLGQFYLIGRELRIALEFLDINDGQTKPRLYGVMQKNRVQDLAALRRQPERHVADAEHRF